MKKIKKILIVFVVVLMLYEGFIVSLVLSGRKDRDPQDVEVLVVLGAKVWEKGPSPVFKERLDVAYDYLITNEDVRAIVSGGQGSDEPMSEGLSGYKYLISRGIDPARLSYEAQSSSTLENILFSMSSITSDKIALVSNDYHIYRAQMLAKRLGYSNVQGLGAISKTSNTFKSYLREIIALSYHYIFTHPQK